MRFPIQLEKLILSFLCDPKRLLRTEFHERVKYGTNMIRKMENSSNAVAIYISKKNREIFIGFDHLERLSTEVHLIRCQPGTIKIRLIEKLLRIFPDAANHALSKYERAYEKMFKEKSAR